MARACDTPVIHFVIARGWPVILADTVMKTTHQPSNFKFIRVLNLPLKETIACMKRMEQMTQSSLRKPIRSWRPTLHLGFGSCQYAWQRPTSRFPIACKAVNYEITYM